MTCRWGMCGDSTTFQRVARHGQKTVRLHKQRDLVSRNAAAGVATTFAYDSAGFRDRVSSPNFGTVDFEHTKHGELWKRGDGKGTTT